MRFLLLLLLSSCSTWHQRTGGKVVDNSRSSYSLEDISGKYRARREVIFKDKKTKYLTKLSISDQVNNQELEKVMAFSKVKGKKLLPILSQYTTWLEKEHFFSQVKYSPEKKSYIVTMKSPEAKWSGSKSFPLPSTQRLCFFSQLPECILLLGIMDLFKKDPDLEIGLNIIWDSYPYYSEQYLGLKEKLFSEALLRVDGVEGDILRIAVEVQGQIIFYTYDENFKFQGIYWVSQGYRLVKNQIKDGN